MRIETPIFLIGSERSGSTLLRLMLDHHPRIAFNLESEYIVSQIADDGTFPPMERYRAWLNNDRVFRHSRVTIDERLDYEALANDFLCQKLARDNKELVGATIHYKFARLPKIWPAAKFIYIYRDGRDVAASVRRMGWAGNAYVAADRWLEAEREWDGLRARIRDDQWIEIRYEDLIADTRTHLARICVFLGVEYSDAMFDYVHTSTYGTPDVALRYQWKSRVRRVDVERIEEKLGERLLARGYALSGYPRISIGRWRRRGIYLWSRLGTLWFRFNRYGVVTASKEILFRRLGLSQLHIKVIKDIDFIIDANLK